jgi:hypothetical protein
LVPAFRLKRFIEREAFNKKYPPLSTPINNPETLLVSNRTELSQTNANENLMTQTNEEQTGNDESQKWFPAKSISRKRMLNKQLQFLVRWEDGSQSWQSENDVTPLLKQKFFIKLANKNRERQRQARKRFKN